MNQKAFEQLLEDRIDEEIQEFWLYLKERYRFQFWAMLAMQTLLAIEFGLLLAHRFF